MVNFFGDPSFNPGGEVKAKGSLHTAPACLPQRVVKLQVLDAKGDVIMAIDEHATKKNTTSGNWSVSGHLRRHLPAGKNSVRVKVKKRTAGKFQCKAGFSVRSRSRSRRSKSGRRREPSKPPGCRSRRPLHWTRSD